MREIVVKDVTEAAARLCKEANYYLPQDVIDALKKALAQEESPLARGVLEQILENAGMAANEQMPLCQDCGTTVVMAELGQDVHLVGGDFYKAIEEGVRQGYTTGYLRTSMVKNPFTIRINTRDNTPPVIHTDIVPGDRLKLSIMPKGGGCENKCYLGILLPGAGKKGVVDFVVDAVAKSGGDPCPPLVVGVGIGGTADKVMLSAKKALFRKVGEPSPDPEVADLEQELLERINSLGIGPQAYGGRTTALAVHVEAVPTHITSIPVGVNLQCHSARHKEAVL